MKRLTLLAIVALLAVGCTKPVDDGPCTKRMIEKMMQAPANGGDQVPLFLVEFNDGTRSWEQVSLSLYNSTEDGECYEP